MAVHVRLQRKGAIHRPFYHIVAADSRCARDGRFIEKIGYYDPNSNPSLVEMKADRLQHWYSRGAQLSECVQKLAKIKNVTLSRGA